MGFSPIQARAALASTESGLDVQEALEKLLSDTSKPSPTPPEQMASGGPNRQRDRLQDYDGWSDEQHDTSSSRRRPRHQHRPSRDLPASSSSDTNYQQQADKIITQASEIGTQLFHRANAFWKEGKSKVQKAYVDRAASSHGSTKANSEGQNERPRWMQEDPDQSQPVQPRERSRTIFRDEEAETDSAQPEPPTRLKFRPQAKPSPPNQTKTADLFSEDAPTAYVSPFRRGTVSSHAAPPSSSVPAKAGPLRTPSPIRLSERQVVSASPSAVSASAQHKASGTEMFKLGRFAEAEAAYTLAISQLPDSHLLLVPLLNNRGLSRLKTGNMSGAIEDCTAVITIIGPSYHPAREAKVTLDEDGAGVDLGDGLVKAWRRRAEAYEGKEKWDLARQDWESIAGADFAGRHRNEASSGIGRCRRMKNVDNASDGAAPSISRTNAPSSRPTATRPLPRPPRRGPTPPSEALTRLKQANQEAEAEEQARLELKDSVDSRLAAWKNGKETNLRALVASLDTVLWPELGWQKVGMAELVTPNQVKIRYTKAIAKLHPDKVRQFPLMHSGRCADMRCFFCSSMLKILQWNRG
jgi:tetratricopeptide (TPR) repeat protein